MYHDTQFVTMCREWYSRYISCITAVSAVSTRYSKQNLYINTAGTAVHQRGEKWQNRCDSPVYTWSLALLSPDNPLDELIMQQMSQNQAEINITWLVSEMVLDVHAYFSDFRPEFWCITPDTSRCINTAKTRAVSAVPAVPTTDTATAHGSFEGVSIQQKSWCMIHQIQQYIRYSQGSERAASRRSIW